MKPPASHPHTGWLLCLPRRCYQRWEPWVSAKHGWTGENWMHLIKQKYHMISHDMCTDYIFCCIVYLYGCVAAHHFGDWHFHLPTLIGFYNSQKGGMAASGPAGRGESSWKHKGYYNLGKFTIIFSIPSKCTINIATGQSALLKEYTVVFQVYTYICIYIYI